MVSKEEINALFEKIDKTEWIRKVEKELRGRPYGDLSAEVEDGVMVEPYYTRAEVREGELREIRTARSDWEIADYYNPVAGNLPLTDVLEEAKAFGADRMILDLRSGDDGPGFGEIFSAISDCPLSLTLQMGAPGRKSDLLQRAAEETKGGDNHKIRFDLPEGRQEMILPEGNGRRYRVSMEISPQDDAAAPVFASMLGRIAALMDRAEESRAGEFLSAVDLIYFPGLRYLAEIARMRALLKLLERFSEAYGCESEARPKVEVHVSPAQGSDPFRQMIRYTTFCMSGAIGGADRMVLHPLPEIEGADRFAGRRIARNIQHLLKLESGLDIVADPAAGSYYIEKMTNGIAEKSWEAFRYSIKKG